MKIIKDGAFLIDQREIKEESGVSKEEARKGTLAWSILHGHSKSGDDEKLQIRFDKLTSHDITYVGIIQTARASGLTEFPVPYVLTNCHNSLCAVGGTINEDDHMFGLSAAKKYGGIYVPPHQAVIHQYAREELSECGAMILGSDSHTRYGALGTMAMGEGGPELVKQLLKRTYDIDMPRVVLVYLTGELPFGVGPQDIAIALIGEVFSSGLVKNAVLEFAGPGVKNLTMDERIGVDVMTTETTCLSSIWVTDEKTEEYFALHKRPEAYKKLSPSNTTYYDGVIEIDLSELRPMIAMPFHPSNAYTIADFKANMKDILNETEERAKEAFSGRVTLGLSEKVRGKDFLVDQGIIAGCAGGSFENLTDAADILRGRYIGNGGFTLSVYPASMPIYMELVKNGCAADIMETGAIIKTAFCGPCFGAGDTPSDKGFSIRHSTRNFPNREGSKVQEGQISSVALMDARSIAATAAMGGVLTGADELSGISFSRPRYFFDSAIYENRVFDGFKKADPAEELVLGPNIKDWPVMSPLPENLFLRVVSEIHDPVTTTDELIPSGETSSYRSNPIRLSEFALSRKEPEYVGRAKEVKKAQDALLNGECAGAALPPLKEAVHAVKKVFPDVNHDNFGVGSVIFAVKPGDGSAREQAASCQKVLGGWANIAKEYATKRYRSNLINWGMLPFITDEDENKLSFGLLDFIFIPGIRKAVMEKQDSLKAFVIKEGSSELTEITLSLGSLTDDEREIILDGCLINFYRREA